ncbi:SPFH domain-containing protein [Streptomyces sp. Root431]|uniref:SPFH domain-containing protein n=1 Tax=Streptomyces sp. Root431 TaxID=1736535 RepID=UPI000AD26477|nr:SPFH domain-containing protein [Streptomyces sp. Root431]
MTASTPTPADSGAAASRDAARTARRLTDGTLPRTSPPTGGEPVPLATATPRHQAPTPPAPAPAAPVDSAPTALTGPVADTPTGDRAAPLPAPGESTGPPAPAADTPERAPASALPTSDTPTSAPVSPGPEAGMPTGAGTATGSPTVAAAAPADAPPTSTPASSGPTAGRPAGPGDAPAPVGSSAVTRTGSPAPAGSATGAPTTAPASAGSPAATPPRAPAPVSAVTDPRVGAPTPAPAEPSAPAPAERAADTAAAVTPAAAAPTPTPSPTPTPTPTREAEPASSSSAPVPASAAVAPVAAKVSVVKERVEVPDFGRITGARVAALSVPVAGVVRVARRKNVIGAETTGSIPVHLLFRDEPGAGATALGATPDDGGPDTVAMPAPTVPAKNGKAAIPAPAKTQQQAQEQARATTKGQAKGQTKGQTKGQAKPQKQSPSPSSSQARKQSRPAPTADPDLVERPGPVLPGWVGVAGGALALAGCAAVVWWAGAVPAEAARMLRLPARPYNGIHLGQWALLALGVVATLFALGGLGRGRVGYAWVLTLFGDYRGTVRRTGLVWVSPLLLRRRVDVRLRHWRSEPLPAVDAKGTALDVTVLVVWRVRDTVRAALGVDGHEDYLREQVEAAMARVLSQLPADAFHEDAPTLRDAEAVGEALTRMLSAECAPVGVDVFSAQPTRIEYAPEVAAAMQRRRIAAIDAKHRDSVLTSVVDAVDDVVHRLTSRGLVELDDYERKALVKDLTVAFYTGRTAPAEGA